jgi:hypothetical protein
MLQLIRRLKRRPNVRTRARWFRRMIRRHREFTVAELDELREYIDKGYVVLERNTYVHCPPYHPSLQGAWFSAGVAA